jgi:hypothetical protein
MYWFLREANGYIRFDSATINCPFPGPMNSFFPPSYFEGTDIASFLEEFDY